LLGFFLLSLTKYCDEIPIYILGWGEAHQKKKLAWEKELVQNYNQFVYMMTVNAKVKDATVQGSKYHHPPTRWNLRGSSVQKLHKIHAKLMAVKFVCNLFNTL
jgi:hypothetical protein